MPIAKVRLPDGRIAKFNVPDGTTPEQAMEMIRPKLASLPPIEASQQGPSRRPPQTPSDPDVPQSPAVEKPPQSLESWNRQQDIKTYQDIRKYVAPVVEFAGSGIGSLLGAGVGTVASPTVAVNPVSGAIAGAGLGYGIAKEALELADVRFGGKAPRQGVSQVLTPVENVLEGAAYETGGRVAGPLIAAGAGKVIDAANMSKNRAVKIAREALGSNLPETINALKNAKGQKVSASQATADITSPPWHALLDEALARDSTFKVGLERAQADESLNALAKLAGGDTAADVWSSTAAAKDAVRKTTTPMRNAALTRANLGKEVAYLERMSAELGEQASAEVQQVRRLMELGDIANASARLDMIKRGLPVGLAKHTYPAELAKKATTEWADNAAQASLDLGHGSRIARDTAAAMRAEGIAPLESAPLIRKISEVANNPEFKGDDVLIGSLRRVVKEIGKATDADGVIDGVALDAIRKNAVNAAIARLRPNMDATSQRKLASSVLTSIKPHIDDAINAAGGKGYAEYLSEHARLSQKVAEKELAGEALDLWKNNSKDAFVRLVRNDSPDTVEKILGPRRYNIVKDMPEDSVKVLQSEADKIIRDKNIKSQVAAGQDELRQLLAKNNTWFRFPPYLSVKTTTANETLKLLKAKVGQKTMRILTEAAKNPQDAAKLLESLPAAERIAVLKILKDPSLLGPYTRPAITGGTAATVNMLMPQHDVKNSMSKEK